jgi:hypothetical protein
MTAMEQAMVALRSAARFADFVAETSGDEDAIALHRQCTEAIGALKGFAQTNRTNGLLHKPGAVCTNRLS